MVPRTSDVILYCTFHSLYLKSSLSLETQPVLKKWYEELSSHRGILDANTMLEANVPSSFDELTLEGKIG